MINKQFTGPPSIICANWVVLLLQWRATEKVEVPNCARNNQEATSLFVVTLLIWMVLRWQIDSLLISIKELNQCVISEILIYSRILPCIPLFRRISFWDGEKLLQCIQSTLLVKWTEATFSLRKMEWETFAKCPVHVLGRGFTAKIISYNVYDSVSVE